MSELPLSIGTLHFTGIGGIGMSGIAEILFELGYQVQGSDVSENANVRRLRDKGIPVTCGQKAENIDDASIVVISTAIKPDNPELLAARERFLPIVHRAEMLGELMRLRWSVAVAGTHGKTTTTSLIATLLDSARIDPTVINGGIITGWGSNARLGKGRWMVVEADESDGSFSKLNPTVAVVTNIDPEHLEHWGSVERAADAFLEFANRVPFYGTAILGVDSPRVAALVPRLRKRFLTYGLTRDAEFSARDLRLEGFETRFVATRGGDDLGEVSIASPGRHIAMNALATIAVCLEIGVEFRDVARGLRAFKGIHRRFEVRGRAGGVTVIDDYGHHPEEVRATLRAAREALGGRRIVVFQPHRYSRTESLFEDFLGAFDDADHLLLLDIHPAGEEPIEGVDADALDRALARRGHADVRYLADRAAVGEAVAELAQPEDVVLLMGAGDIIRDGDAVVAALSAAASRDGAGE